MELEKEEWLQVKNIIRAARMVVSHTLIHGADAHMNALNELETAMAIWDDKKPNKP